MQQLQPVSSHQTVNHSVNFVDPATGVHTKNIESYWNRVKRKFKHMKGVHESMVNSYLDEFMWRERHGRSALTALASLCRGYTSLCYQSTLIFRMNEVSLWRCGLT